MSKLWIFLVAVAGLIIAARPVAAHHAGANYDREHLITLTGTVTKFVFINPHAQIFFDVKDANGKVAQWLGVGDPPQRLFKLGWTKNSLKPGDEITVTGGPKTDGTNEIDIRNDQLIVNGKKLSQKEQ